MHDISYLHSIHAHTSYLEDITDILLSLCMYNRWSVPSNKYDNKDLNIKSINIVPRNWIACPCTFVQIHYIHTCMHCIAYLHYVHTHTRYFKDITVVLLSVCMCGRWSVLHHKSQTLQSKITYWTFSRGISSAVHARSFTYMTYMHACNALQAHNTYIHILATS